MRPEDTAMAGGDFKEPRDDGGAAFPWGGNLNECPTFSLGMSLRDYFAAQFMERAQSLSETNDGWSFENAAQCAYGMADAMIAERDK